MPHKKISQHQQKLSILGNYTLVSHSERSISSDLGSQRKKISLILVKYQLSCSTISQMIIDFPVKQTENLSRSSSMDYYTIYLLPNFSTYHMETQNNSVPDTYVPTRFPWLIVEFCFALMSCFLLAVIDTSILIFFHD